MTPAQFLSEVVRPNVAEFRANDASIRLAHNAVAAVDSLSAHIYQWCKANAPTEVSGLTNDTHYRKRLAAQYDDFGLLRDIAKALKHVRVTRNPPQIAEAKQISTRDVGYGEGPYGDGRYGGPPQVVVDIDARTMRYVGQIVDSALSILEGEISRLRI